MATLNWKTPNGSTGNINIGNIVLTNTNQTISGSKTFSHTIGSVLKGDATYNQNILLQGRGISNGNNNLYTDTYVIGVTKSTAEHTIDFRCVDNTKDYSGLAVETYDTNGSKSRIRVYGNNGKSWNIYGDSGFTTRGFVGAQGGVSSSTLNNTGYIVFKSGIIIQWGRLSTRETLSAGGIMYKITFPIAFTTACTGLFAQDYDVTAEPKKIAFHSFRWYPAVPVSGSNIKNSATVTCTSEKSAIQFFAIGY